MERLMDQESTYIQTDLTTQVNSGTEPSTEKENSSINLTKRHMTVNGKMENHTDRVNKYSRALDNIREDSKMA